MKLIKIKITPHSSFVTFPKGDTIFGHFAYHSFLEGETIFKKYVEDKPKIIFSDILPDGYLYKPTLPLSAFGVDESEKKEFRKKIWLKNKDLQSGDLTIAHSNLFICLDKSYNDILSREDRKKCCVPFYKTEIKVRNSLNRVTFSTDDSGEFAPFSLEEITFTYQPVIYILFDENENKLDDQKIVDRLNLIGKIGFGKKGSIGKGHFSAELDDEFKGFDEVESDYYLTLSPTVLNKQPHITKAYYNTFNRFGKSHSSSTPFKKPLLMADSGAVVKMEEKRNYIGRGIENGINTQSFVQGYSIVIPFDFKGALDG